MKRNFLIAKLSLVFVMLLSGLTDNIIIFAKNETNLTESKLLDIKNSNYKLNDSMIFYKNNKQHSGSDPDEIVWKTIVNKDSQSLVNPIIKISDNNDYLINSIKIYEVALDASLKLINFIEKNSLSEIQINSTITKPLLIEISSFINIFSLYADQTSQEESFEYNFDLDLKVIQGNNINQYFQNCATTFNRHLNVKHSETISNVYKYSIKYNYDLRKLEKPEIKVEYENKFKYVEDSIVIFDLTRKILDKDKYKIISESDDSFDIIFTDEIIESLDIIFHLKFDDNDSKDLKYWLDVETDLYDFNFQENVTIKAEVETIISNQPVLASIVDTDYSNKTIIQNLIIDLEHKIIDLNVIALYSSTDLELKKNSITVCHFSFDKCLVENVDFTIKLDGINNYAIKFLKEFDFQTSKLSINSTFYYRQPIINETIKYGIANQIDGKLNNLETISEKVFLELEHFNDKVYNNGSVISKLDETNNLINWEILANYNQLKAKQIKIRKKIVGSLSDDFKIAKYDLNKDGSLKFQKNLKQDEYSLHLNNNDDFVLLLNNSEPSVYKITYSTILKDIIVKEDFDSEIVITVGDTVKKIVHTVEINHGKHHLSVHGKQEKNLMLWEVLINPRNSTVKNVEIKSALSSGSFKLDANFNIYPAYLNEAGIWVKNKNNSLILDKDYTIEISSKNQLTIKFLNSLNNSLNKPYILKFYSNHLPTFKSIWITNTVTITGNDEILNNFINSCNTTAQFVEALKEDIIDLSSSELIIKNKNEKNETLLGGVFDLQVIKNKKPLTLIQDLLITNDKVVQNLPAGQYRLSQKTSPKGYLVNSKPLEFTISLDENNFVKNKKVVFVNKQASLFFYNINERKKPIANSEFIIESLNYPFTSVISKSDVNGLVEFNELAPNDYLIKQIKTSESYILNTMIIKTHIEKTAYGKKQPIQVTDFINYLGGVKIIYQCKKEKIILNGEFELYNADNKLLKTLTLNKDQNIINDLKPGDYKILNTKATTGYTINKEIFTFTVNQKDLNKPNLIEIIIESEKTPVLKKHHHEIVDTGLHFTKMYYVVILLSGWLILISKKEF